MDQDAHMRRIIDNLSSDLNNLSSESKRKFAPVKEASEACLLKLRQINSLKTNLYKTMCDSSVDVLKPLILGCETKQAKIIQICLTSVQKIIEAKILNTNSASNLIATLWLLTDSGLEELKVLQTIILLVTTTDVVKHQLLAKTLSIGLRIASSKDQILVNTATAMLSQMVTKVFERVLVENKQQQQQQQQQSGQNASISKQIDLDQLKSLSKEAPSWMNESSQDAYMLLQDIYLLLNSDQALWLVNIHEINKPFGLELLKSILIRYPEIFFNNPEMCFILKERICPLLIKLFSPSTKLKLNLSGGLASSSSSASQSNDSNKNASASATSTPAPSSFAIVSRLIRIVHVLIKSYFELLVTESEIFLSLLTKLLDAESARPVWQKALVIECLHKIALEPRLIELIVVNYDMQPHPEKIFHLMCNGIALFIQSLFLSAATASGANGGAGSSGAAGSSGGASGGASGPGGGGSGSAQIGSLSGASSSSSASSSLQQQQSFAFQISSAQPSFVYKDTTIQLLFPYVSGQIKSTYLDSWDKADAPYIQDGYLLSIGFSALQELSKSVQTLIEQNLTQFQQQQQQQQQQSSEEYPKAQTPSSLSLKRLNLTELQLTTSAPLLECLQIMSSCCNSFLFVYNILLESSLDEAITDQILKSIRSFVYLSSLLGLNLQRDAFVTALCKAALPANYAHYVLNLKPLTDLNYLVHNHQGLSQQQPPVYKPQSGKPSSASGVMSAPTYDDSSDRQIQVVAIGPALAPIQTSTTSPSLSSSSSAASSSNNAANQQFMLYITAKNLLIMKSLLNMSHMYSELLGSAWYIVLNTLQHLTWALGLRPTLTSQGQLKHIAPVNSSAAAAAASSSSSSSSSATSAATSGGSSAGETMITTAIQTEVAFICNMLSKLFESTKNASDQALGEVVDALIRLAIECADYAHMRTEPCCVFAIAKLYETSLSNLSRFQLFWQKVTLHLLCASKHSNTKYREWCVDSLCSMIRATFSFKYATTNSTTTTTTTTTSTQQQQVNGSESSTRDVILQPLCELSSIGFADVRQKQLECTLSILRLMGQHLNESWPLCLNIIGAIQREHTDILIRSAFQCLQLVVTDFLSMIGARHLTQVIQVVAQFGSQEQDLNISLTAIVLLWNISDYMFQQADQLAGQTESGSIRPIWMVLYGRLGQLCVDSRPAVRKSAAQTLFCTISSHGSVLGDAANLHWNDLVWKVLFPLLEQVRHGTLTASREKDKHANHPNFLMHHSRDTAEKQWAETTVLTLAGVTRVFNSKCAILMKLPDGEFHKMWTFLMRMIKSLALSRNAEIALAALRGFHELLGNQNYFSSGQQMSNSAAQTVAAAASAASAAIPSSTSSTPANNNNNNTTGSSSSSLPRKVTGLDSTSSSINTPSSPGNNQQQQQTKSSTFELTEWLSAWQTWLEIGSALVLDPNNGESTSTTQSPQQPIYTWPPPSQTFLTIYVDLVQVVVDRLAPQAKFTTKDFEQFSIILDKLLSIPVLSNDYSSFILMQLDSNLTPLQNSALTTVKHFIKLFKSLNDSGAFQSQFIALVFQRLLSFILYACYTNNPNLTSFQPISNGMNNGGDGGNKPKLTNETIVNVNFVPFGEKALLIVTSLYEENANNEAVIENNILKSIIQTLYVPLSLKYSCPNASTWKLSIECLFRILKKALPIAQKNKTAFETIWMDLAKTFEDFLFSKNISSSELPLETIQHDELIDCQVIELIRDDILTHAHLMPAQFVQKVLNILNRGSIYSNTFENFLDLDSTRKLREEFSKTCFETLLRFSFVNGVNDGSHSPHHNQHINGSNGNGETAMNTTSLNKMALTSMLTRCKDILQRYAHDEKLSGNVPLPRVKSESADVQSNIRARTNEIIGVLKALGTLISALKKAPKDTIPPTIWNQVIGLFPLLVECTTSPSSQVSVCVKETLHHYFSLLKAP